jgi:uncharacterized protein
MATQSCRETDGIGFTLRLTPKGSRDAVDGWAHDAGGAPILKARVTVPPEDGKANVALVSLLAATFAVPKSAVTIISGATARTKRIQIGGDRRILSARLNQFGDAK